MYQFQLIPKENMNSIIPLLQLLNEKMEPKMIEERLEEMIERGYECLGVYEGEKLIGICGIWTLTKIYAGRHIEPDNVTIHPDYRNQGIGEQMMKWVDNYARSKGCIALELNAYVVNSGGHRFWLNQGYRILGFHFQKKL
jgi:GNAT superfamily N-acetyltransferase